MISEAKGKLAKAKESSLSWLLPDLLHKVFYDVRHFILFHPGHYDMVTTALFSPADPRNFRRFHWEENDSLHNKNRKKISEFAPIVFVRQRSSVNVRQSIIVLLFGACIGGLICWTLKICYGQIKFDGPHDNRFSAALSATGAALLPAVCTILLSRLGTEELPVSIKIEDFWGALAAGFALQWIGQESLVKLLGSRGADGGNGANGGNEERTAENEKEAPEPTVPEVNVS